MITYADGTEALPGDHVNLDGTPGIVEAIVDSSSDFNLWGLKVPGIMVETTAYGLMFDPSESKDWDALVFQRRSDD